MAWTLSCALSMSVTVQAPPPLPISTTLPDERTWNDDYGKGLTVCPAACNAATASASRDCDTRT